jgi:hypothetical protein
LSLAINSSAIAGDIPGGASRHQFGSSVWRKSEGDEEVARLSLGMFPLRKRVIAPADAGPESRRVKG